MKKKILFTLGLATLLASATQASQDQLARSIGDAHLETSRTDAQLTATLGALNALTQQTKGDLKPAYKAYCEEVARTAARRAVEMLGAKPVGTQKVPVVFDRYAAPAFWSGVLSALSGDAVYRKTTFMTEMLDKDVASPLITVEDDATRPRHIASAPFDGEGGITRKNTIIDQGRLRMFFYDSQTARKAGVKTATMARRMGYRSGPAAGFLCVTVANGQTGTDASKPMPGLSALSPRPATSIVTQMTGTLSAIRASAIACLAR